MTTNGDSWHLNNTINVSDTVLTALQLFTHWLRQAYEVGAIIIPILQMKKLREVK